MTVDEAANLRPASEFANLSSMIGPISGHAAFAVFLPETELAECNLRAEFKSIVVSRGQVENKRSWNETFRARGPSQGIFLS
jgi:hypothetical protein